MALARQFLLIEDGLQGARLDMVLGVPVINLAQKRLESHYVRYCSSLLHLTDLPLLGLFF
jgi:hypothetical protein